MTCGRSALSGEIAADDLARRREFEDWPEPQRKRHLPRLWLSDPSGRPLLKVVREGGTGRGVEFIPPPDAVDAAAA
jgi:hypothetical protein